MGSAVRGLHHIDFRRRNSSLAVYIYIYRGGRIDGKGLVLGVGMGMRVIPCTHRGMHYD